MYVVRSRGDSGAPVSGSEILAINGVATLLLISRCLEHVSSDGGLRTRGFRLIERDFTVTCGPLLGLPFQYVVTS